MCARPLAGALLCTSKNNKLNWSPRRKRLAWLPLYTFHFLFRRSSVRIPVRALLYGFRSVRAACFIFGNLTVSLYRFPDFR